MTQQATNGQISEAEQKRSRGPGKPFPSITFEEAMFLPRSILEHGFDGEIQRLTLLRELDYSPNSSKTRGLITASSKYGLTEGSYNAPSLAVTEAGRLIINSDLSTRLAKEKGFELAINQFGPFKNLYDRLKDNRLREGPVLHDELKRFGVSDGDCQQAAKVFTANLSFLGIVYEVAGNDYVRSIEQALEELTESAVESPRKPPNPEPPPEITPSTEGNGKGSLASNQPGLHIDIQVHIDPTSSADQIDQIFASMAKHLYGNKP